MPRSAMGAKKASATGIAKSAKGQAKAIANQARTPAGKAKRTRKRVRKGYGH
jgi:hypothetical protein